MGKKGKDILNFNDLMASWPKESPDGMEYAVAAVSEGFCPTHKIRLVRPPKKRLVDMNEQVPLPPQAHGFCTECKCVYATGKAEWNHHAWLLLQDRSAGCIRSLVFNPRPEVDEDEDFYADDIYEEEGA